VAVDAVGVGVAVEGVNGHDPVTDSSKSPRNFT
jgi:hypothetical protein